MFTGIIEDRGVVSEITAIGNASRIVIGTSLDTRAIKLGDSISVNGVCLTVTDIKGSALSFDVSFESLKLSNLKSLKRNDRVNIERALMAGGRFDGHIVSGHIDGVGKLVRKEMVGDFYKVRIGAESSLLKYVVKKGSIAVDGISLTVNEVYESGFDFVVIPHTIKKTTLEFRNSGDIVNLETDVLAKYVEKLLINKEEKKSRVDAAFLAEHGFI